MPNTNCIIFSSQTIIVQSEIFYWHFPVWKFCFRLVGFWLDRKSLVIPAYVLITRRRRMRMIDIHMKTFPLASMHHMKQTCNEILVWYRCRAGCGYERYSNSRILLIQTPSANKITCRTRNLFNQHLIHGLLLLIDLHLGKGISSRLHIEVIQINGLALQERD